MDCNGNNTANKSVSAARSLCFCLKPFDGESIRIYSKRKRATILAKRLGHIYSQSTQCLLGKKGVRIHLKNYTVVLLHCIWLGAGWFHTYISGLFHWYWVYFVVFCWGSLRNGLILPTFARVIWRALRPFCCVLLWLGMGNVYPYSSGLFNWYWAIITIALNSKKITYHPHNL